MMRRIAMTVLSLLLASLPLVASGSDALTQRIQAEKAKAARIHAALAAKRGELHQVTLRYRDLQAELHQTNVAIDGVSAQLGALAARASATQRQIDWNTRQLHAAQRSLALFDNLLRKRLVDIYEYGNLNYLSVLLSSTSFSDFVERWEDLKLLIAANERTVRERARAERKVATVQTALERTQLELVAQEQAEQRARDQLGSLATERANLVAVANRHRRQVAAQVAQMEDISAAEEAALEALIQERSREIAAQQKAAGIAGAERSPGSLSWPVTGIITSPFGWRPNPFGGGPEFHQGLDIAAPTGTTVTAAASGTVIMAQWYGGYGNYILIDHGGGLSTGYGHLSAIYVSVNQHVTRGQAIGAVGMTGEATGPHLHFEVRINGKPVDPAPRLH